MSAHIITKIMNKKHTILYLIILFALALKLYGINFEVPHPDDYITVQAAMHFGPAQVELSGHGLYGLYVWPSTGMVYIEVLLFSIYYLLGWAAGIFPDIDSFKNLYLTDPSSFFLICRIMCIFFGVASVAALYSLAKRLYGHKTAIMAAFFLSANFLYSMHSQFIRPDVLATFISIMTLIICLSILDTGNYKYYIAAGVLTGFAISIKFTSGILVVLIVVAHVMAQGKELFVESKRQLSAKVLPRILISMGTIFLVARLLIYAFDLVDINSISLSQDEIFNDNARNFARFLMNLVTLSGVMSLIAGLILRVFPSVRNMVLNIVYNRKLIHGMAAVLVSFIIFDPVFFLNFKQQVLIFIADANYLGSNQQFIGIDSLGFLGNLWWYIKGSLNWGSGLAIEIMAGIGLLIVLSGKRKEDMPVLVFALMYLLVISAGRYRWERYAVTLMPFMALYASVFLNTVMDKIAPRKISENKRVVIMAIIAIFIVLPSTYNILRYGYLLTQKDTRVIAKEWVESNITSGSRLGQDAYTGILSAETYEVSKKFSLSNENLDFYIENNYDYLMVSDTQYLRYMNEPLKYEKNVEFYNRLFAQGTLVKEFKLRDDLWPKSEERFPKYHIHISPTIKIYKIK